MKKVLTISLFCVLAGCSSMNQAVVMPSDASRSIIGLSVKNKPPIAIFARIPDKVYFIRLQDKNDLKSGVVIPSNYQVEDRFYLLDAAPGTYLVAGTFLKDYNSKTDSTSVYMSFHNDKSIIESKMDVAPASFVYGGDYTIKESMSSSDSDEIRKYYGDMIRGYSSTTTLSVMNFIAGSYEYSGDIQSRKNDEKNKADFVSDSKKYFSNTPWTRFFN